MKKEQFNFVKKEYRTIHLLSKKCGRHTQKTVTDSKAIQIEDVPTSAFPTPVFRCDASTQVPRVTVHTFTLGDKLI